MRTLYIILLILSAICFALAAADFTVQRNRRPFGACNWIAAGLLLWVLVPLLEQIDAAND